MRRENGSAENQTRGSSVRSVNATPEIVYRMMILLSSWMQTTLTFLRSSGPGVPERDELEPGHASREGLGRARDRDLLRVADRLLLNELDQEEVEQDGDCREGDDRGHLDKTKRKLWSIMGRGISTVVDQHAF